MIQVNAQGAVAPDARVPTTASSNALDKKGHAMATVRFSSEVPRRRVTDVLWNHPERRKRALVPLEPRSTTPVESEVITDPQSRTDSTSPPPDLFRSHHVERWLVRGVDHQPNIDE